MEYVLVTGGLLKATSILLEVIVAVKMELETTSVPPLTVVAPL
jgi:hypothetical protein